MRPLTYYYYWWGGDGEGEKGLRSRGLESHRGRVQRTRSQLLFHALCKIARKFYRVPEHAKNSPFYPRLPCFRLESCTGPGSKIGVISEGEIESRCFWYDIDSPTFTCSFTSLTDERPWKISVSILPGPPINHGPGGRAVPSTQTQISHNIWAQRT